MISSLRKVLSGRSTGVLFVAVAAIVLLFTGRAMADGLTMEKKVDGLTVIVEVHSNPPAVGTNHISLELLDAKKKAITNAKIELHYFMPMMPAMAHDVVADLHGDKYGAMIDFMMAGKWQVDVSVTESGSDVKKVSFTFEAK